MLDTVTILDMVANVIAILEALIIAGVWLLPKLKINVPAEFLIRHHSQKLAVILLISGLMIFGVSIYHPNLISFSSLFILFIVSILLFLMRLKIEQKDKSNDIRANEKVIRKKWYENILKQPEGFALLGSHVPFMKIYSDEILLQRHLRIEVSTTEEFEAFPLVADPQLKSKLKEIIKRAAHNYQNRPTVRLLDFQKLVGSEAKLLLRVQKARYFDYLITNNAIFQTCLESEYQAALFSGTNEYLYEGITDFQEQLENHFIPGGKLPPLDSSHCANHIGLNCILTTQDGFALLYFRGQSATFPYSLNPVSATAWRWGDSDTPTHPFYDMWRSIRNETQITETEIAHGTELMCLGFARELNRAGKPEAFFLLNVDLSASVVAERIWKSKLSGKMLDDQRVDFEFPVLISIGEPPECRGLSWWIGEGLTSSISPTIQAATTLFRKHVSTGQLVFSKGVWWIPS